VTLPTRGFCHAVFLLAQSVRFRQRDGLEDWVRTARQMPTVMASALALEFVAKELLTLNLEHVPPQLNQGDSRGAEDGRGYRH
jgi:hypothetical protein